MRQVFEGFIERQGWSLDSQVEILLRYIEQQQSDDAFFEHLEQQADEENGTHEKGAEQ